MKNSSLPIGLIKMGGTISGTQDRSLSAEEIGQTISKGSKRAQSMPMDLWSKDSREIGPEVWSRLAEAIHGIRNQVRGVVIPHGSFTLANTAAALECALGEPEGPIVLTASQMPIGETGSDALPNLEGAMRVAAEGNFKGVVAYTNGKIYPAGDLKRTGSAGLDFLSAWEGPVGNLTPEGVELNGRGEKLFRAKEGGKGRDFKPHFEGRVPSLVLHPGMDESMATMVREAPGSVWQVYGPGAMRERVMRALKELAKEGKPVVLTSDGVPQRINSHKREANSDIQTAIKEGMIVSGRSTLQTTIQLMHTLGNAPEGLSSEEKLDYVRKEMDAYEVES